MGEKVYIAIDLKSFYASHECMERKLDPLKTNLVVADESRTEKTICLAVSPSLKAFGIPGRARLFEVVQKVKEANALRLQKAPGRKFTGASYHAEKLEQNPSLAIDYIVAKPQMAHYVDCSTKIYQVYLKYIAPEDIHVYSIDEVFIDATSYLKLYDCTAVQLAKNIVQDVLDATGITATAGIGTNLYLCKIAMDIVAKKVPTDDRGLRIAELDEQTYRKMLWTHRPLTDFWRVGRGYAKKLEAHGMFTMGDIARCSLENEELLYKLFGINAELLIDHAWGWEPCTIADIKAYKPQTNSISSGQVLHSPYDFHKAKLIVKEMTDALVLDLVDKKLVTDQMVLTVGYDRLNLDDPKALQAYKGEISTDFYGRKLPKHAHGTVNLKFKTSSTKIITEAVMQLYDKIVDPALLVRRMYVVACHIVPEHTLESDEKYVQVNMFEDQNALDEENSALAKEKRQQRTILQIKKKYGKNSIVKAMNLQEGATAMDRNGQIGGHKA